MYNLFQYSSEQQRNKSKKYAVNEYQSFLHHRQNYKKQAQINRTSRFQDFLNIQSHHVNPHVIPDDYMVRNKEKEFGGPINHLDIEKSQQLFPNYRKNKAINDDSGRVNKKISHFSLFGTTQLSKYLMKQGNNSQQGQSLQLTKQDLGYLSHSVPLKQSQTKLSQSGINFKERANKILKNHQDGKRRWQKAMMISKDRYRLCHSTHFDPTKIDNVKNSKKLSVSNAQIQNGQESLFSKEDAKVYYSEIGQQRRRNKTYFKLAKTTQLFSDGPKKAQLDQVLSRSHYDRVKSRLADSQLTNPSFANMNSTGMSVYMS